MGGHCTDYRRRNRIGTERTTSHINSRDRRRAAVCMFVMRDRMNENKELSSNFVSISCHGVKRRSIGSVYSGAIVPFRTVPPNGCDKGKLLAPSTAATESRITKANNRMEEVDLTIVGYLESQFYSTVNDRTLDNNKRQCHLTLY